MKPTTVIVLGLGIVGAYFYMQRRARPQQQAPGAPPPASSSLPLGPQAPAATANRIWD